MLEGLLILIIKASIAACCMGFVILLFNRIFYSHTTPGFRFYIWLIIIIRLVLPIDFETAIGLADIFEERPDYSFENNLISKSRLEPPQNLPLINTENTYSLDAQNTTSQTVTTEPKAKSGTFALAPIIWLAGIILYTLWHFVSRHIFFKRLSRENINCSDNTKTLFAKTAMEMGIKNNIPLLVSAQIGSPSIISATRPRLLLPYGIESKLSPEDLSLVFRHELLHCKRQDLWIFTVLNALRAVYWFNPVLWYLFKKIEEACEASCDSQVLKRLPQHQYSHYGMALIKAAALNQRGVTPLTALSLGKSYKNAKRRIKMISDFKNKEMNRFTLFLMVATLSVAAISIFSSRTTQAQIVRPGPDKEIAKSIARTENAVAVIEIDDSGQIIIPKTKAVTSPESVTHQDNYLDNQYILTLNESYREGNHKILRNEFITEVAIENLGDTTQLLISCDKITAFEVTEDKKNIYFTAKNPKDVYKNILVIIPSHGGADNGATASYKDTSTGISTILHEKNLALDLALAVESISQEVPDFEMKVYLSRREDIKNELSHNANFANQLGGVCIDLHFNYTPNEAFSGTESYYPQESRQSKMLSELLQTQLTQDLQLYDNHAKEDTLLYMLKNVKYPVVTLELACLNNSQDLEIITSKDFTNKAALSILNSVHKYYTAS